MLICYGAQPDITEFSSQQPTSPGFLRGARSYSSGADQLGDYSQTNQSCSDFGTEPLRSGPSADQKCRADFHLFVCAEEKHCPAAETYTATIESAVTGAILRTSSGTYTISGAENPLSIGNPQGHLNLTDFTTGQLIDGDIFLLRVDQFVMSGTDAFNPSLPSFFDIVWTKQTL
jgi:hypothetical protein